MSVHAVEQPAAAPVPVRVPRRPHRTVGVILTLAAARLSYGVFSGLTTARGIIDDFESVHGPLQYTNGWWDHRLVSAEASRTFCDQLDAAAGWLYPFGVAVWVPVAALWTLAVVALTWHRPRLCAVAVLVSVVVVIIAAASFGSVYADAIAVLE